MAFDYSSRDYSTIRSDLLARAQRIVPEWTDRDPADFGMVLVDLWAQMGDVLHYYVDRAAGEAFLPTATQRESVLAYANLFDYAPANRTSAAATITLRNTGSTSVTIPQYTRFIARYDDVSYQVYATDGGIVGANSDAILTVREGTIVNDPAETLTTSASGRDAQRYRIANKGVVLDSMVVTVYEDGVTPTTYRRVLRLSDTVANDRVYVTNTTADGYIEIVFGSANRGFVPPANSTITAVYAYSSGSQGNLPANSITSFRSTTPQNIQILSSSSFNGGFDDETIRSMRATIPSIISAQNRAVTANDYISLALGLENVSKAAVSYTPSGSGNASVTVYPQIDRSVDYLSTSDTSQTVSSTLQTLIVNSLQPKAILGVEVLCASSITWRPIDVAVTVNVNDLSVAANVKRDVETAIDRIFAFSNVFFGQTLSVGAVYRAVMGTYGVDYATVSVFDDAGDTAVETTITVGDYELPKKGTVVVTVVGGITST